MSFILHHTAGLKSVPPYIWAKPHLTELSSLLKRGGLSSPEGDQPLVNGQTHKWRISLISSAHKRHSKEASGKGFPRPGFKRPTSGAMIRRPVIIIVGFLEPRESEKASHPHLCLVQPNLLDSSGTGAPHRRVLLCAEDNNLSIYVDWKTVVSKVILCQTFISI